MSCTGPLTLGCIDLRLVSQRSIIPVCKLWPISLILLYQSNVVINANYTPTQKFKLSSSKSSVGKMQKLWKKTVIRLLNSDIRSECWTNVIWSLWNLFFGPKLPILNIYVHIAKFSLKYLNLPLNLFIAIDIKLFGPVLLTLFCINFLNPGGPSYLVEVFNRFISVIM